MFSRIRIRALALTGALLAGMLAAGCGGGEDPDAGTNGVGKLTPERIEARTRAAAESAKSVRMAGTVVSKGTRFRIDMRLSENGGVGEVHQGGSTFELLRVGDELFLKADEEFYRSRREDGGQDGGQGAPPGGSAGGAGSSDGSGSSDSPDAAEKLEGKYVKVPSDDPAYEQLSRFTDLRVLLDGFFVLDGELDKGERGRIDGVPTLRLEADEGRGGAVEVSLQGTPYPLRYTRAGGGGTLELSDYNMDFTLKAPDEEHVVDYGELITGTG